MSRFLLHVPKLSVPPVSHDTRARVVNRIFVIDKIQWLEYDPSVNVIRIKYDSSETASEIVGTTPNDPSVLTTYNELLRMLKTNADETRIHM